VSDGSASAADLTMADALLAPYAEALDEFPLTGSTGAKLRAVVKYAICAPSSHNSQPWRFRIREDALELLADRQRRLRVSDFNDRELLISCGAALHHLRVALRHFGCRDGVEVLPKEGDADLVARVRLAGPHDPTAEDHLLFAAIPKRRTCRAAFRAQLPGPRLLTHLQFASAHEGAGLHFILDDEVKTRVAELVMRADAEQMADKAFRTELAAWLRGNRTDSADGMPGYAFGMNDLTAAVAPLVVRTFDLGRGRAAKNGELASGSPALGVVSTLADGPRAWIGSGQALARVLLRATVDGVSASFLNQPIELPTRRLELGALLRLESYPQLLLRFGYGPVVKPTPRRAVEAVLEA
jgi:hypothetical protein